MILFVSFYYPIGAFFILSLGLPSTPVNVLIKASTAGAALYLIIVSVMNDKKQLALLRPIWFIFIFWIGYSIRLLYDINIEGIRFGRKPLSLIYGYAFGNILLPILATVCWHRHLKIEDVAPLAFKIFTVANILVFVILVQQNGGFNIDLFLRRAYATPEGGDTNELVLNPIAIGYFGSLLSISSLYFLLVVKKTRWWIYLPLFLFGMLMLVLGASRGPFISSMFSILFILFYRFRISYSKVITLLKSLFVVLITGIFLAQVIGTTITLEDFSLYNRLSKMAEDRQKDKKETRDYAWSSAWQDYLDSPIIGKQFVGTYDSYYPHNIILEVPMATGTIGSLLFLGFFLPALFNMFKSYWNRDHEYFFLATIFTPIFISKLFSGCLFLSIDFWMILLLLISFKVKPKAKLVHVRESKPILQSA